METRLDGQLVTSHEAQQVAVEVRDTEIGHWSANVLATVDKYTIPDGELATYDDLLATGLTKHELFRYLPPELGGSKGRTSRLPLRSRQLENGIYVGDLSSAVLEALNFDPEKTIEVEGNLLVNQGIQRTEDLLIAVVVQGYDNTHARIGTGNSATAAVATDTDLNAAAGSGNRQFQVMDATFPSRASQTLSFKATFTTGVGNYAWQEWMIDNGTANGTTVTANALNHKVTSLGTKTSAAAWAFTVTLVYS